ncbi:MAG: HEAT repeat domain-containing protein [Planctomycetes bacterium]|nr:HEAT repeat domain-containing protein [Planctomycetota bacterium]
MHAAGNEAWRTSARGGQVRVSRALGPLAAVPVAGLAATLCALAVLPADEGREPASGPPVTIAPADERRAPPLEPPSPPARVARSAPSNGGGALDALADATTTGPDDALERLLIASTSHDEAVRARAVAGLSALPHGPDVLSVLARLVDDPAPDVASDAALALARSEEGRRALVGRLLGPEAAGLAHLACADALLARGTLDEVPALVPLAEGDGPMAEAAAAAVRAICERAGVDSPLPPPEPPGEARPPRD